MPRLTHILAKNIPTNYEYVNLTGLIIKKSNNYITLLDCSGTTEIYKKNSIDFDGLCSVRCKVYNKKFLYLVDIRRATIYEEMYRWIEMYELERIQR